MCVYIIVYTYSWLKVMHSDLIVSFYRSNQWQKNMRNNVGVVDMSGKVVWGGCIYVQGTWKT